MQNQKGFTIIELIVVIAIIAVLATIVMINVTGYIAKSKDAAIKGNMSTIATSAASYYDTNKTYVNVFLSANNPTAYNAINQITTSLSNGAPTTGANASAWCVCSNLTAVSGNTYCADSTGYRNETTSACSARCNVSSAPVCVN